MKPIAHHVRINGESYMSVELGPKVIDLYRPSRIFVANILTN